MINYPKSLNLDNTDIENCLEKKYTVKEFVDAFFAEFPEDCKKRVIIMYAKTLAMYLKIYGDNNGKGESTNEEAPGLPRT